MLLLLLTFLLGLVGLGGVIVLNLRLRAGPGRLVAPVDGTPPSDLPPAMVGALMRRQVYNCMSLGTIVDFARRGHVAIASTAGQTRRGNLPFLSFAGRVSKCRVQLISAPAPRNGHEAAVWAALTSVAGADGMVAPPAIRAITGPNSILKDSLRALRADMVSAGYFSAGDRGRPLSLWAMGCGVTAGLGVAAGVATRNWGVVVGIALLVAAGILGAVLARVMPETTEVGEQLAAPWRGYLAWLAGADARAQLPVDVEVAAPYVVAAWKTGDLGRRVNWLAMQGYRPSWYRTPRMTTDFAPGDPDCYALWCDSEVMTGSSITTTTTAT